MISLVGRTERRFLWEDGASTRECEFPQQSRIFARLHRHKRPKGGLMLAFQFFIAMALRK
jgi:hypothetical protein